MTHCATCAAEDVADACNCETGTPGCGHYGCWGDQTGVPQCPAIPHYAAATNARLDALLGEPTFRSTRP